MNKEIVKQVDEILKLQYNTIISCKKIKYV